MEIKLVNISSRTLSGFVDELARAYPDLPAVTYRGQTVSFAGIRALARTMAKGLYRDGVRRGDKVGILMGNCIEWLVVNFAIQYLGATMVALNTWYTERELAYVMKHGDVSVLVTADSFLKRNYVEMLSGLQPWGETFPALRTVAVLGGAPGESMIGYDELLAGADEVGDLEIDAVAASVLPDDIAYLLYTSGSTAHPKGVMLGHRGLIENMAGIGAKLDFGPHDVLFLPVSLFWGMGCENGLFAAWTHATRLVLQHHFDAAEALELIERYRCTAVYGTANIVQGLFLHPDRERYDLSSLTKGMSAGTPEQLRAVIHGFVPRICNAYGLTETYGFVTCGDASDPAEKRAMSNGRLLPGMDIRIVSPESEERLPVGVTGEVRMRGYTLAGYYKNEEATAEALDDQGYFKTGDLGYFDEDGYFYFRGRLKEMLKTGGLNVSPIEVEEVLRTHPLVEEAFVTGLPDAVRDEIVAAVVVLSDGAEATVEELLAHCRASLAAFKIPRQVRIVRADQIPLTTTGKVHKARLSGLF